MEISFTMTSDHFFTKISHHSKLLRWKLCPPRFFKSECFQHYFLVPNFYLWLIHCTIFNSILKFHIWHIITHQNFNNKSHSSSFKILSKCINKLLTSIYLISLNLNILLQSIYVPCAILYTGDKTGNKTKQNLQSPELYSSNGVKFSKLNSCLGTSHSFYFSELNLIQN